MKNPMYWAVLPLPFLVTFFVLRASETGNTVKIDGYPHAVVICGEAMIINYGHFKDPQILQLMEKAKEKCK